MTPSNLTQGENVIPLPSKNRDKASEKKWGTAVMKIGFCIVPSLLLRAQKRLGLNSTQLAVLLQLVDFWWSSDRKPYPSKKTLGERLNLSARQVQRYIRELEKSGFIRCNERYAAHRGRLTNEYDLSGLVDRLKKLEPEFREVKEKTREMKRQVTQRGGIPRQIIKKK